MRLELSRSEDFLTSTPAPACKVHLKMGALKDGTLCGLDATIDVDNGVYAAAFWSSLLALLMGSGYKISKELLLMAKYGVYGVYNEDPRTNKNAKKFDKISYQDALTKKLIICKAE